MFVYIIINKVFIMQARKSELFIWESAELLQSKLCTQETVAKHNIQADLASVANKNLI